MDGPNLSVVGRHDRAETILLVEDEESLRELVTATLTEAGYQVIAAASGLEALALWELHGQRVDLLLTDMQLPGKLNGYPSPDPA